jgi:hypothetical protein
MIESQVLGQENRQREPDGDSKTVVQHTGRRVKVSADRFCGPNRGSGQSLLRWLLDRDAQSGIQSPTAGDDRITSDCQGQVRSHPERVVDVQTIEHILR